MRSQFRARRCIRPVVLGVVGLALVMSMTSCGKVEELEAYIWDMESYVYGYPLVMMEVTREVLPTPPGQFNLTLRNYFPKEVAYDGSYKVPPVRKVK